MSPIVDRDSEFTDRAPDTTRDDGTGAAQAPATPLYWDEKGLKPSVGIDLSSLTPAMRAALTDANATVGPTRHVEPVVRMALIRQRLTTAHGNWWTQKGLVARGRLLAESAAAEALAPRPATGKGNPARAFGYLEAAVRAYLDGPFAHERLAADLERAVAIFTGTREG